MMSKFSAAFVLLAFALPAVAQTTRTWDQSSFEDFEKGTSRGVAIRSDGLLELAPAFRQITTTPSTYIWSIASDADGNLIAAAGAPARVYRITPQGEVSILLQPQELEVQAIAIDRDGTIYAATSPDGRIYRIQRKAPPPPVKGKAAPQRAPQENQAPPQQPPAPQGATEAGSQKPDPNYAATVFFEPKTKYIWDLALDADGRLYAATGDRGEIYRIEKNGTGSLFFKSDEAHIRALTFDRQGNLIAGSDGSGLVYRISPRGEAFVLYSAPKKEITALTVDAQGNIYAAAAGDKRAPVPSSTTPSAVPLASVTQPSVASSGSSSTTIATTTTFAQIPVPPVSSTGSEVYRISPDGSPRRIWRSKEDLVYALTFDSLGRLLAGTGNKGKIYAISTTENDGFTDLLRASASQVIGFAPAPGGGLWAVTSNLGKVFLLQEAAEHEGTFDSDVYDAKTFSRWGRIELRARGNVEFFGRSGNVDNPDRNWSPWQKIDLTHDAPLQAPPARFVQWRAVFHSGNPAPRVDSLSLYYLPQNVAPEVDDVTVSLGRRYSQQPRTIADVNNGVSAASTSPTSQRDAESIAVRWTAKDENEDQLTYSVYYRGENETRWQLLKSGLADHFYYFDSNLLPDGRYTVRVVASDAPSHSPEDYLTGARESAPFDVDNTPPVVGGLAARIEETGLHITFRASDNYSVISHAEYSVDAGDWQFVAPIGGIADSRTANYDFTISVPRSSASDTTGEVESTPKGRRAVPQSSDEHVIVVRVYDRSDNVGTSKVVVIRGAAR